LFKHFSETSGDNCAECRVGGCDTLSSSVVTMEAEHSARIAVYVYLTSWHHILEESILDLKTKFLPCRKQ
jgi:hypothetical protein